MSYVRSLLLAGAVTLGSCATPQKQVDGQGGQDAKVLGERISKICTLPEPQRTTEIEKLKKESGMVLYCGK